MKKLGIVALVGVVLIGMVMGCQVRPSAHVTAMTFNLRHPKPHDEHGWDERRNAVADMLDDEFPDIVGFQEVTRDMYDDLTRMLGDRYDGYGFMRSEEDDSEMTPVFLKRHTYDLLDKGHFFLSETPEVDYSIGWDAKYPRVAAWVVAGDPHTKKPELVVINTHFDHKGIDAQTQSGKLVVDEARRLGDRYDCPTVVMGDLNSSPVDLAVLAFTDGGRYLDSYHSLAEDKQQDAATSHKGEGKTFGKPIDYIFVEKPLSIAESRIVTDRPGGIWPSDHFPVVVNVVAN